MKCIRCSADSKYSDRTGGICPSCKGAFAFEPKEGDRMTDAAFKAAIDRVSAGGHVRFGVENLYYEICRKLRATRAGRIIGASIAGVVSLVTLMASFESAFALIPWIAVFGPVGWAVGRSKHTVNVTPETFDAMWAKWLRAHGPPPSVIQRREQPATYRTQPIEPDLGDYSFDRAVICDRARTVDLLLANNFHFENNCAVLSIGGYPVRAFERVRAMLRNNPRIAVFALHDVTYDGCTLAHRLASDPAWFRGVGRVVDVGLRPRHAKALRGLWLAGQSSEAGDLTGITAEERAWLATHQLELAAIRPEQVIKRLFREISGKAEPEKREDEAPSSAGDLMVVDAYASDGGDDSFG